MNHSAYLNLIDAAVRHAESLMDLADVQDAPVDEQEQTHEDRYHCGVCVVRTVMEDVWPPIDLYIRRLTEALERERALADQMAQALRLTAEYADLPAIDGWSWFDAYAAWERARSADQ